MSNVTELQSVYVTHGYNSKEFINQVKNYISFLLNRYYPKYNQTPNKEDLIQECWLKLHKALGSKNAYYKPHKGSLATFIYTSISNTIRYIRRKDFKSELITYEYDFDSIEQVNTYNQAEDLKSLDNILSNFSSLRLSANLILSLKENKVYNSPLHRYITWKNLQS